MFRSLVRPFGAFTHRTYLSFATRSFCLWPGDSQAPDYSWDSPVKPLIDKTSDTLKSFLDSDIFTESQLHRLKQAINDLQQPFRIGLVGDTNKGKTAIIKTLTNSSKAISSIIPGNTSKPTLYVHENIIQSLPQENQDNVEEIIPLNLHKLEGLLIVDLPGLNTPQSYGHDDIVRGFLHRCDQIILVTSIQQIWSGTESNTVHYIKTIEKDLNMISVINKVDQYDNQDENELNKGINHRLCAIKSLLNTDDDHIHKMFKISALQPNHYLSEWDSFCSFLYESHEEWEFRDAKKCEKSMIILQDILDELSPTIETKMNIFIRNLIYWILEFWNIDSNVISIIKRNNDELLKEMNERKRKIELMTMEKNDLQQQIYQVYNTTKPKSSIL